MSITFGQAIEEYCKAKARKKSLAHDRLYLGELKAAFGADTLLIEITAARINGWKNAKLSTKCARTGREYSAASINRPLAALRHLLQLAHEQQWATLTAVPKIRLEEEPEGRIRWLEPDEETRLLEACRKSKNRELVAVVTVALETGLRRGELLGLTWDRVDLSRGVIRLEVTKSGRRRELPALQKILGHADLKMTLRYARLAPHYLRDEIARTERPAQAAAKITQAITHEPVAKVAAAEAAL